MPFLPCKSLQWLPTAYGAKSRLLWIIARTLPISLVQCRHLLPIKLNLSDIVSMCSHRPMSSHFFTLFLGFLIHKCEITVFILPYHSAAPDTANHFCSPESLPLASISTLPLFLSLCQSCRLGISCMSQHLPGRFLFLWDLVPIPGYLLSDLPFLGFPWMDLCPLQQLK